MTTWSDNQEKTRENPNKTGDAFGKVRLIWTALGFNPDPHEVSPTLEFRDGGSSLISFNFREVKLQWLRNSAIS